MSRTPWLINKLAGDPHFILQKNSKRGILQTKNTKSGITELPKVNSFENGNKIASRDANAAPKATKHKLDDLAESTWKISVLRKLVNHPQLSDTTHAVLSGLF